MLVGSGLKQSHLKIKRGVFLEKTRGRGNSNIKNGGYLWEPVRYSQYHGRPSQPRRHGLWHAAEAVPWKYTTLTNIVPAAPIKPWKFYKQVLLFGRKPNNKTKQKKSNFRDKRSYLFESVPGSCRVLGAHEEKGNGCGEPERHKSAEDGVIVITEHRWVEVGRSEWPL